MSADSQGRVDLGALLRSLADRGIRSVMVEGGAQVLTSFLQQREAHALVITVCPRLVGGVHAITPQNANDRATRTLPRLGDVEYIQAGDDLVIWAKPEWNG